MKERPSARTYAGAVCPRGHDDGTGHSARYVAGGKCVACLRERTRVTYRSSHGLPLDAPTVTTVRGRQMVLDGPLERAVARADVVYDAYWRDAESAVALRWWFGISMGNVAQIVFAREGRVHRDRRR